MTRNEHEQELTRLKHLEWYFALSDEEREAYHAAERAKTTQFKRRVEVGLVHEGLVTTPERFDEIADQIEAAAPSWDAAAEGVRTLGRWYTHGRAELKRGLEEAERNALIAAMRSLAR